MDTFGSYYLRNIYIEIRLKDEGLKLPNGGSKIGARLQFRSLLSEALSEYGFEQFQCKFYRFELGTKIPTNTERRRPLNFLCRIWYSHSSGREEFYPVGYNAV
jgi:hypothetical protein